MKIFVLALALTGCGSGNNNNNPGCMQFGAVCLFPPLDPATQRACDATAANGCVVPSATGCMLPKCNDGLMGRTDDRKYCRDTGGGTSACSDRLRWEAHYSLDNVPTNKQLVIRTAGPT